MSHHSIQVVVTYRVCQHWRAHIFAKLNSRNDMDVVVFHGKSIPGTKCINGENLKGFPHKEHVTIRIPFTKQWTIQPFLFNSLRRQKPDVILAEGGSNLLSNFLVLLYAKMYRRPVIWWTLGEIRDKQYKSFFAKVYRRMVVFQERVCSVYLGYSDVALKYFDRMGYDAKDCFLAVNSVDTNRVFSQIESRKSQSIALRETLGLSGKRVILFVGAFTDAKRIDRLIRVFATISEGYPATTLLLVGDGPASGELAAIVDELQLGERVTFTGKIVENVSDYYELGDIFVLPGLGGLAISEAMAHRIPVICTIADGCEVNFVVNGQTGFRIFSNDDGEVESFLKESLIALLSDSRRLESMSSAALDRICNVHNVETYVQGIVDSINHAESKRRRKLL